MEGHAGPHLYSGYLAPYFVPGNLDKNVIDQFSWIFRRQSFAYLMHGRQLVSLLVVLPLVRYSAPLRAFADNATSRFGSAFDTGERYLQYLGSRFHYERIPNFEVSNLLSIK